MLRPSSFIAALLLTAALALSANARAEAASWLFAGAGPSAVTRPGTSTNLAATLQLDAGLGSAPSAPVVVGGLARMTTRFSHGTDFGLFLRTATGGYARGNFGLALDLGGYTRTFGDSRLGYAGSLSLGAPWGITLGLDAAQGEQSERTFALVLGIDFARLSVYRTTGLGWMPNPFPGTSEPR